MYFINYFIHIIINYILMQVKNNISFLIDLVLLN